MEDCIRKRKRGYAFRLKEKTARGVLKRAGSEEITRTKRGGTTIAQNSEGKGGGGIGKERKIPHRNPGITEPGDSRQ